MLSLTVIIYCVLTLFQLILDTLSQLSQAGAHEMLTIQRQFQRRFLENEGLLEPDVLITQREFVKKFEEYSGSSLMHPIFLPA